MVKVAYAHATYICHGTYVDYFNTSFLANPWQYKYEICTNNAYRMENENMLLSWQPINGSHTDVNKFVLAVITLKYRAEVID